MSATPSTFEELESLCQRICHVLERENAILRSRNGLIGEGIEELEGLQAEKDSSIALLERASRDDLCIAESRRSPERAERVRRSIGHCKDLQMRNHQIFSRVVSAQRKIISVLRQPEDDVNLYDRAGRSRDYGVSHRSELA
jgi:flagellar biosynthesis/type III secretory pathway chaperone